MTMTERDWLLIGIGFVIGIPVGIILLSFFTQSASSPVLQQAQQVYENEEKWTWVDWKGRQREIIVKREAKAIV
jgi:uncharacterized membrane-anchored protein YhcB (DUF1043 family)